MNLLSFLAVGFGAFAGAVLRWLFGIVLNPILPTLPLGTLAANLLGGLLMGGAMGLFAHYEALPIAWRLAIITGFLGGTNPQPVKETEIQNINVAMTEGAARPKARISFEMNETVRVIDGPFANFTGVVVEVKAEKQKIRVNVSIFGRATPVELDFAQVEKS